MDGNVRREILRHGALERAVALDIGERLIQLRLQLRVALAQADRRARTDDRAVFDDRADERERLALRRLQKADGGLRGIGEIASMRPATRSFSTYS